MREGSKQQAPPLRLHPIDVGNAWAVHERTLTGTLAIAVRRSGWDISGRDTDNRWTSRGPAAQPLHFEQAVVCLQGALIERLRALHHGVKLALLLLNGCPR